MKNRFSIKLINLLTPVDGNCKIATSNVSTGQPVTKGGHTMSKRVKSKTTKANAPKTTKPKALPAKSVTVEPQHEEHMHLDLIAHSPAIVDVYLPVSDDEGHLLGDMKMETRVKSFCDRYRDPSTVSEPDKVIEEAKILATEYTLTINKVENRLSGTITKYRIRQGTLFNIMKELVRKSKPNWMEWFKANFDPREFRSVQDYMKLARIKNIIRYAVFGKERLMHMTRQLSDEQLKLDDPIGAFLKVNKIKYNPKEETDNRELRIEADVAINHQKLLKEGITEISKKLVAALVRNGRELEKTHIEELKRAKEHPDHDVVKYMKGIIDSDGKPVPIMTPDRKAEGFKKTAERFLKAVDNAFEDREYIQQLDREMYNRLKQKVLDLESLIVAS
jgi:hypothetical protein